MALHPPAWQPPQPVSPPATTLLREYADHLVRHRGNPERTVCRRLAHVEKLTAHLAGIGKTGDDGADRYRRFFDRMRGAVCAFDGGRPRRKCPQLRPIPARHRADFGRPGGIHCFAAAAEVRASPPCPAVGGRTASAARCGHVVATGPARLCTSAVDEQLRVRGQRGHPAAAPGYRLECRHAQSRAAEDRRRLHAAAAAVGGQGACVLPARRPAAEHPAPLRIRVHEDAVQSSRRLVRSPPHPRQACEEGRGERALPRQPRAAPLERGAPGRYGDTAPSALRPAGHRDPESISAYVRIAAETLRELSLPVPT
jgi:hypothetical protein